MNRVATTAIALLFAVSTLAQSGSTSAPPAAAPASPSADLAPASCGPVAQSFNVALAKSKAPAPAAIPGKAVVYFIQDDRFNSAHHPYPIVKWAVDGSWIGATRHKAYFRATLDPGDYHLCASWQVPPSVSQKLIFGVAILHAKASRIYYFRAENLYSPQLAFATLNLTPIPSGEGAAIYAQSGTSVFTPKN
jgi:hypothetical protein